MLNLKIVKSVWLNNIKVRVEMVEDKDVPEEFNIEEREYKSVFKMFEKGTPGEINIQTVFEFINKFDQNGS